MNKGDYNRYYRIELAKIKTTGQVNFKFVNADGTATNWLNLNPTSLVCLADFLNKVAKRMADKAKEEEQNVN